MRGKLPIRGRARVRHADGFDFSSQMRLLCRDMVTRLPELAHVDLSRVAFSFAQARKGGPYGIHASLTPMRFRGGTLVEKRRGIWYATQRLRDPQGREMLYILTFYLPRFMDTGFREKLTTVLHELWHVSPRFDGDIRRHAGRCFAHSGSQRSYDAQMARLAERWLGCDPPLATYGFLQYSFGELQQRYGRVYGLRVSRPKLIPVSPERAAELLRQGQPAGPADT